MTLIERVKGDNYPLDVQLLDNTNTPLNLQGATCVFTVKRNINDTTPLILVSTSTHTSPTEGITSFPFVNADTNLEGTFLFDVKIIYGSIVYHTIKGNIIFSLNVG